MKLFVLSENTAIDEAFAAEHGLSIYIEAQGKRILFDTGASSVFADNAQKLGVDLSKVDFVILSHGHNDHGGGLAKLLELNSTAKIYAARAAFGKYYNDTGKDISVNPELLQSGRVVLVDDSVELAENMTLNTLVSEQPKYAINTYGLKMAKEGQLVPDTFLHEHYLTIVENGKRVVFSGCSHRGILNIMNWLKPDVVVGGFHFFKLDLENSPKDRAYLEGAAKLMQESKTSFYTCHCTGLSQFAYLQKYLAKLEYLAAGSVWEIE